MESQPRTTARTSKELAQLGLRMREAQKVYFQLALSSSQSKFPDYYIKEKRKALEKSKQLEKEFDVMCSQVLELADQTTLFEL